MREPAAYALRRTQHYTSTASIICCGKECKRISVCYGGDVELRKGRKIGAASVNNPNYISNA